jgi:VIT1/CCC1 family predicted Fe2+/Mn2+ transporter
LSQPRAPRRVSQFAGLFLGLGLILRSYYMRELLACWLFFSLVLVSLALMILGVVLACYAGKYLIHWATRAVRVVPTVALCPSELHVKKICAGGKMK